MKIYFASGKFEQVEMDKQAFTNMVNRMKFGGIRFVELGNGCLVPLNSNTIEYIDSEGHGKYRREPTVEEIQHKDSQIHMDELKKEIEVQKEAMATQLGVSDRENPSLTQELEKKDTSNADREKNALAEIIARSNCKHEEDKLVLRYTAGKKGTRYFRVCSFCGWRDRFIKAESLTEEEKQTAAPWEAS